MKNNILKEGFAALFFLLAGIVLILGPLGILTVPGIIVAGLCVFAVLKRKYNLASILGIIAALGSFIGQALTALCPTCFLAATLFAIGGILCLLQIVEQKPIFLFLLLPLAAGLILLGTQSSAKDVRPVVHNITPEFTALSNKASTNKPLLFVSPTCPACTEVERYVVKKDPGGKYWQPVIVPQIVSLKGIDSLRKLGYTGAICSAAGSPNKMVPCLVIGNKQVFWGKQQVLAQINKIIKRGQEHSSAR